MVHVGDVVELKVTDIVKNNIGEVVYNLNNSVWIAHNDLVAYMEHQSEPDYFKEETNVINWCDFARVYLDNASVYSNNLASSIVAPL